METLYNNFERSPLLSSVAQTPDIDGQGLSHVYHTVLHVNSKDGKIWFQQNTTHIDLGQELQDIDVSEEDIVFGMHPAHKRHYTGYDVA